MSPGSARAIADTSTAWIPLGEKESGDGGWQAQAVSTELEPGATLGVRVDVVVAQRGDAADGEPVEQDECAAGLYGRGEGSVVQSSA